MDRTTALRLRMRNLLLTGGAPPPVASVAGIVSWFGALQAQDVNSALWSLGVRLPGVPLTAVNAALEDRSVLRTWPMRGTVHLVPARDAHWMLELTGVRALAGAAKRRDVLGLAEATVERAVEILAGALAGGRRLTRAECLAALAEGGVEVRDQRGYHLLWYAAQRGVTAIAPHVGSEQTFVLLDEWVPDPHRPDREEALALLALRYFRSHGPAPVRDFAGWTGLTVTDCRAGIAAAGDELTTVDVDGAVMVTATGPPDPSAADPTGVGPAGAADPTGLGPPGSAGSAGVAADGDWLALPGFDEYLLGYKDRSLMVDAAHLGEIVPGGNGVFRSTLVCAGRVVATWTRTLTAKGVTVTVRPLTRFTARDHRAAAAALEPYAAFLGRPLTVKNP